MNNFWDRRNFIQRIAISCTAATGTIIAGLFLKDKGRNEPNGNGKISQVRNFQRNIKNQSKKLVVSHGDPEKATRAAINALGGIESFVKPDETVVIKPNIGWDRTPIQAANTNPIVVKTIVEMCFEAKASKVIVTDHSCNEARRCFTRSGIWKLAKEAGATIVLPAPHRFRLFDLGGTVLGKMPVLSAAVTADRFINVPIAKHHGLSGFTGAMKNLYGVLGGRRNRLHQHINDSIADLADFIRPTLTVMDATRVLFQNGPQGGDLRDTKVIGQIIASVDQVAVDTYSCGLIGLSPKDISYLTIANKRGLGENNLANIDIQEIS